MQLIISTRLSPRIENNKSNQHTKWQRNIEMNQQQPEQWLAIRFFLRSFHSDRLYHHHLNCNHLFCGWRVAFDSWTSASRPIDKTIFCFHSICFGFMYDGEIELKNDANSFFSHLDKAWAKNRWKKEKKIEVKIERSHFWTWFCYYLVRVFRRNFQSLSIVGHQNFQFVIEKQRKSHLHQWIRLEVDNFSVLKMKETCHSILHWIQFEFSGDGLASTQIQFNAKENPNTN